MTRPVQAGFVVKGTIKTGDQSRDALITNENHSKVLGVRCWILLSFPYAPVVGHPFEALEKVKGRQVPGQLLETTDQTNGKPANEKRNELVRFYPHKRNKEKRPERHYIALGAADSIKLAYDPPFPPPGLTGLPVPGETNGSLKGTPGGGPGGVNGRPNWRLTSRTSSSGAGLMPSAGEK